MVAIKNITKTAKVCDICGSDRNVFEKCCICDKDICFSCNKEETFMPSSDVCRDCWKKYPFLEKIRSRFRKLHYKLEEKEAQTMKKEVEKYKKVNNEKDNIR